jgi:hypothetical protein
VGSGCIPHPGWGAAFRLAALALLVGLAAGCGLPGSTKTISKSGPVGQAFDGPGSLQVQLVRFLPRVAPGTDVSGLATPKPGTHFVSFLVHMCVQTTGLPTISQGNFDVPLRGGGAAEIKFPETVYTDDLNILGTPGCETGHIVFQVPRRRRPSDLRFALDVLKGDVEGNTQKTKIRFDWTLPA